MSQEMAQEMAQPVNQNAQQNQEVVVNAFTFDEFGASQARLFER